MGFVKMIFQIETFLVYGIKKSQKCMVSVLSLFFLGEYPAGFSPEPADAREPQFDFQYPN